MTAHSVVSILLALQNAATEEQADALIRRLASPFLRAEVHREWDRLHATAVTRIEES